MRTDTSFCSKNEFVRVLIVRPGENLGRVNRVPIPVNTDSINIVFRILVGKHLWTHFVARWCIDQYLNTELDWLRVGAVCASLSLHYWKTLSAPIRLIALSHQLQPPGEEKSLVIEGDQFS